MSNSPQQDDPLESAAVSGVPPSLNGEAPAQPDPPPKSDPEAAPSAPPIPDPDEVSAGEDEDDDEEGEELDEETLTDTSSCIRIQPPAINDCHVAGVVVASPTGRRGGGKRKKGKGKGKGKPSARRQQLIESTLQILREKLNPIPFIPHKILDFAHHEKLLRKLGLWEFVHIDFDRSIRVEFIAQLVANYNPKLRSSNVNGCRVMVNRADLARSLKLPFKKERVEVVLDSEDLSDDSLGFVLGLLSDWVVLHEDEDTWLVPREVSDCMKLIKDGHPEKVDWAALLWFMVEKELKKGDELRDCHYASHLQQLIKYQRENLFVVEEDVAKDEVEVVENADKEDEVELVEKVDKEDEVELVEKAGKEEEMEPVEKAGKEEEDVVNEEKLKDVEAVENTEEGKEGDSVEQGPSTELTLGQEKEDEEGEGEGEGAKGDEEGEGVKDLEMANAEKCKDSSDEELGEDHDHDHNHDRDDHDQEPWLLNGKDIQGEHFLQRCSSANVVEFTNFEGRKDEEEEEMEEDEEGEEEGDDDEARNNFHVFHNDDSLEGDGFTGNFLQGLEGNQMAFTSQEQLRNSSVDARVDVLHMASTPSFFNNSGKRVIDHEYDHSVDDSNNNKRMRINETWNNKPLDFATCMEQIQQVAQRARMLYEEKEQASEQSTMNQQILINEVQKRDALIEHLHKVRLEETQKKDVTINRLERELYLMGSVLDGYRKALKETRKAFADYKERAKLVEEPTYRDAGQGGLMLTAAEIERRRKKREEFRMNCLYVEQRMKEVEEEYLNQFHDHVDRVNFLDNRLMGLKDDVKELIALHSNREIEPTKQEEEEEEEEEEKEVGNQDVETPPVAEPMEEEAVAEEVSQPEKVQVPEPEVQVPEAVVDDEPNPQPVEKAAEVEPLSVE